MIILSILAALSIAPSVILAVKGPGELELMTTPKNFGVIGAEIAPRRLPFVPVFDTTTAPALSHTNVAIETHADSIPLGMRVGADA